MVKERAAGCEASSHHRLTYPYSVVDVLDTPDGSPACFMGKRFGAVSNPLQPRPNYSHCGLVQLLLGQRPEALRSRRRQRAVMPEQPSLFGLTP
ncbi:MAG: hypothetical protein WCA27_15935 [Candidatus Sulfotelmatobacter sp.]